MFLLKGKPKLLLNLELLFLLETLLQIWPLKSEKGDFTRKHETKNTTFKVWKNQSLKWYSMGKFKVDFHLNRKANSLPLFSNYLLTCQLFALLVPVKTLSYFYLSKLLLPKKWGEFQLLNFVSLRQNLEHALDLIHWGHEGNTMVFQKQHLLRGTFPFTST